MDKSVHSLCGINCHLCEQYLRKRCRICANEEDKRDCEALKCVRKIEKVDSCFLCKKVDYCKRRERSIDDCLIIRPRRELTPGFTMVLGGPCRDGMTMLAKHVFVGKEGVLFTDRDPSSITEEFMLGGIKIYRLTKEKPKKGEIHTKDIDKLKNAFEGELKKNDIVVLDALDSLIAANSYKGALDLVGWMDEKILQSGAALLIMTGSLKKEQKDDIKHLVTDSKIKKIIKSISNPKRMEVMGHLQKRGKSMFTEIYESLGYSVPPKLSFHLRVLRDSRVIEQDAGGVYYLSDIGVELGGILDKIGKSIEKNEAGSLALVQAGSPDKWNESYERYQWYIRRMSRVNPESVPVITDVKNSLGIIFGEKTAEKILQAVLKDYIETERKMDKSDQKRMVSEIAFVFLVDSVPLVEAIDWADELLKKHGLKQ